MQHDNTHTTTTPTLREQWEPEHTFTMTQFNALRPRSGTTETATTQPCIQGCRNGHAATGGGSSSDAGGSTGVKLTRYMDGSMCMSSLQPTQQPGTLAAGVPMRITYCTACEHARQQPLDFLLRRLDIFRRDANTKYNAFIVDAKIQGATGRIHERRYILSGQHSA